MAHHGNDDRPIPEEFRQLLQDTKTKMLGATGEHPEGKLTPSDEGGINFAVGVKDGKVCIDFGTSVTWLGMNPGQALQLAELLIEKARKAAQGSGSILTLNL